jgi:hypothetical protein
MKSKIIQLLVISIIIGSCTQKKPAETTVISIGTDYALIPNKLNGKVKELKELNFWAVEKDGKLTKGELMSSKDLDSVSSTKNLKAYFNEAGMITKYEVLDRENILQTRLFMVENGKYSRFEFKIGDSATYYGIPKYDDLGYLIEATVYRPVVDTVVNKQVMIHDGKGNYTKYENFNSKDIRTAYQNVALDEKGNVLEVSFYDRFDSLRFSIKNIYGEKDNIIRQETNIEKPKSMVTWDYKDLKLDDHGNWTEEQALIDNGKYKIIIERTFVYY